MRPVDREYPIGAEIVSRDHASLRVWAPDHDEVAAIVDGATTRFQAEGDGYFSAIVRAHPGSRYGFRFPGDDRIYPDPASRWMPDGPDGLSAMVDLGAYRWRDAAWRGVALPGQVLVGFAAESHDTVAFAREKLKAKGVDLMVANDITQPDAGFAQDTNRVHFLFADGRHQALPLLSKGEVAHHILDAVKEMLAAAEPSP